MKTAARCPGCGKHCPMGAARCKYGVKYFEKMNVPEEKEHRYKWEKLVEKGGLMWRLLMIGRSSKKALRNKKTTEAQILGRLSADEKAQLSGILDKLESPAAQL